MISLGMVEIPYTGDCQVNDSEDAGWISTAWMSL